MPAFKDPIYLGGAQTQLPGSIGGVGVGPVGNIYVYDIIPLTLQADGLAVLQSLASAGDFALTAGTGVTKRTKSDGQTLYEMDVPRCVSITATVNYSGILFSIFGYDFYGQNLSVAMAGPNNTTVATTKAFKSIYRASASAGLMTGASVGFNDKFGLPFRVTDAGYIASAKWDNTLAQDAGTFVAADQTSPATTLTTDVRGCYTPSSASDGVKRLVMGLYLPTASSGQDALRVGALGVSQNLAR